MPKLLKPKLKQTLILNMNTEVVLELLQRQFWKNWRIDIDDSHPEQIVFRASRDDVEIIGKLQRWEGTNSRLHLDGKVLLETPYENWRDQTGIIAIATLIFTGLFAFYSPFTSAIVAKLVFVLSATGWLLLTTLLIAAFCVAFPRLLQRYFTENAPELFHYAECQKQLAQFFAAWQEISESQDAAIARLQDSEHVLTLGEIAQAMSSTESQS